MSRPRSVLPLLALLAALAASVALGTASAQAQATRTWISGVGDDTSPTCSRTAPCKTLVVAQSRTAAGGEINALDPSGYGTLTITKAITIDLSSAGGRGGVLNLGGINGLVVNAGAQDDVVIRGVDVYGAEGFSPVDGCKFGGLNGIRLRSARSLRVDDTTIGSQGTGILLAPDAANADVLIDGVDITNVCARGIDVSPANGVGATVTVRDTTVFNAGGAALFAGGGGNVFLSGSTFASSGTGIDTSGGGTVAAVGENTISANDVNGEPTTRSGTAVQPKDGAPGAPGAPGATGPAGPAGPAGAPGTPAIKLLLAMPAERLAARAGRRVQVRYASTVAGRATLELRKGAKVLTRVRAAAKPGRNALTFAGKINRKALKPGTYVLRLIVDSSDGQSDAESATLRVTRR